MCPEIPKPTHGGMELDMLNDWRQNGFAGHTAGGLRRSQATQHREIHQSIALFGGVYIGLLSRSRLRYQDVWDVAKGGAKAKRGSWGGHCVFVAKYDKKTLPASPGASRRP